MKLYFTFICGGGGGGDGGSGSSDGGGGGGGGACVVACISRSDDSLQKSVFSFYHNSVPLQQVPLLIEPSFRHKKIDNKEKAFAGELLLWWLE